MANLLRFGRRPLKATLKDTDENAAKYEAALFDKDGCQFLRYVGQGRKPVEVRADTTMCNIKFHICLMVSLDRS